jgi:hypothetical protein
MVIDLKRTSMVSGEISHFESGSYTNFNPRVSTESFLQASIPFFHGPSGDALPSGSTRVPPILFFMMEMLDLQIKPLQPKKKKLVHRQASGDSSRKGQNKKQNNNNACSY